METLTPQTETVETPAATEVVTSEAPAQGLHEMSKADRDAFLRDGKVPATEKKADKGSDDKADSSTAPAEGEKAAETAASKVKPASEPGAPAKDKKARNSEENRVNELLEERKRDRELGSRLQRDNDDLRKRLDALERQKSDGTKASSTDGKPDEPKWKAVAAAKEFPKIEDFDSPNEWAAAVHLHTQQTIESALSAKETAATEQSEHRQVLDQAYAKGASEIEADPTVLDRIDPGLENLKASRHLPADQRNKATDTKDFILYDMDKPLGLMAFYSTDEGRQEWAKMMSMDGRGIQRTIIARELSFGSVPQGDAAKATEKKAVVKNFTKAPTPPEKEGPKGALSTDGAKSAVESGDFAAFQAEMDAKGDGMSRRYGRRAG